MWEKILADLQRGSGPVGPLLYRIYAYLWIEHRLGTFVVLAVLFHWLWLVGRTEASKASKKDARRARAVFVLLVGCALFFFVWLEDERVRSFFRVA